MTERDAAGGSPLALLLIDVVNDLEFEGGEALLDSALPIGGGDRRAQGAGA